MDLQNLFKIIYSNPYYTVALAVWALIWRGLALWKASQKKQKYWFIALLIINTLGLLEIFYLFLLPKIEEHFPNQKDKNLLRKK